MKNIIKQIKDDFMILNQKFIDESIDRYDFWENHIKFVVKNALSLARKYDADKEIVQLGALLHDIALVEKVGTKLDHHTNGAKIAEEILTNYNYPKEKRDKVVGCVLHHRSSKNAENIEELCVADADILAHFDNQEKFIKIFNWTKEETLKFCQKDFDDLSDKTKEWIKPKYEKKVKEILEKNF